MHTKGQGLRPFTMIYLNTLDNLTEVAQFIETRYRLAKTARATS